MILERFGYEVGQIPRKHEFCRIPTTSNPRSLVDQASPTRDLGTTLTDVLSLHARLFLVLESGADPVRVKSLQI